MWSRTVRFGVVLAFVTATPALAQEARTVTVRPGERVTVAPDGRVIIETATRATEPFRLGLGYSHGLGESGELAYSGDAANALGLEFSFRGGRVVREHVGIAHRWERSGASTRKGFRADLIALGFPIPAVTREWTLHVEPILRLVRGDLLFASDHGEPSHVLFRLESGAALQVVATVERWFFTLEPAAVDFRYFVATSDSSRGGFATLFSFALLIGREF
jgi:hypothetical protein